MEINIRVEGDSAIEDAALLQKFIEKQNLDGLESVEMERAPHQPGQQGLGKLLGGLIMKLTGGAEIVKEILTQMNLFATKYDRRIVVGDIVIPTNKLSSEQIERIVIELIKNQKSNAGS